jgi:hypothetical protein
VIANVLLVFAAVVVFLAILTIAATMLSSSISDAEDRYESMRVEAPSTRIAETPGRSETNQVGVFESGIAEVGDPANS